MSSQLYVIDKINKLIDINREITNFKAEFNVKSINPDDEYYFSIENQTTLDNNSEPEWKHITSKQNGEISGDFTIDDGVFQNYFIILKADKPTEVNVFLNVTPLSNTKEEKKLDHDRIKPQEGKVMEKKQGIFCTRNLVILGVIVIVGAGLYYFFVIQSKNKQSSDEGEASSPKGSPVIKGSPSPVGSPLPSLPSSPKNKGLSPVYSPSLPSTPSIKPIKQRTQDLLNRLRRRKET